MYIWFYCIYGSIVCIYGSIVCTLSPLSTAAGRLDNHKVHSFRKLILMPRGAWHHTVVDTDSHTILWQMQFFHKLAQRTGRRFNRFVIDVHYHNAFIFRARKHRGQRAAIKQSRKSNKKVRENILETYQ